MRRRTLLKAAAGSVLAAPALGQDSRARTLRLVPATDLISVDPLFTSPLVVQQHGYHVFDTLYGVDATMQPRPQMAEGHSVSDDGRSWTIRLRPGLMFHDGQPVRAADCVASLVRWALFDPFGRALNAALDRYVVVDDRSFRVELQRPFPLLLHAISKPHNTAFVMPERIVTGSPGRAVTEVVGSGPYRFLPREHDVGSLVAYARFEGYVPRNEKPEWTSGGKVAHFDRIEWRVIADKATAAAALQQSEVDIIESIPADLAPMVASNRDIRVQTVDPFGTVLLLRFNHIAPPFDNAALRRFVMAVARQSDYLATVAGDGALASRICRAMFPCTVSGIREAEGSFGTLDRPRSIAEALEATGYAGERVAIINPTDNAAIAPLGMVTADLLQRAGLNVDLQSMDWGTMTQRRLSKAGPEAGGWSIYHSSWPCIGISTPVTNTPMRGEGETGWPGWYRSEAVERLTVDWLAADGEKERAGLVDAIQQVTLHDVPTLPLGIFYPRTAYRTDLQGLLAGQVRFPWNIRRVAA